MIFMSYCRDKHIKAFTVCQWRGIVNKNGREMSSSAFYELTQFNYGHEGFKSVKWYSDDLFNAL